MKSLKIILTLLFTTTISLGQVNLTGNWKGTSTYKKVISEINMTIEQEQNIINGEVMITRTNGEFFKYKVDGTISGTKVTLKGYETIDSKGGLWCYPTIIIDYDSLIGEQLVGKWRYNLIAKGCLPGISGGVHLVKEPDSEKTTTSVIEIHDEYTSRMIEGLQERNYHALIIAVQNYEDPEMLDLDNPISDAETLITVLKNKYSFPSGNINFLQDPSRSEVINQLDAYSKALSVSDNLLIFYAGHGIWDSDIEQGFWLPANAKRDSKSNWISNGTIRDYLKAIDSKHTLLITDACFSGGILKERNAFTEGKAMTYLYRMPSRKAMTSGTLTTVPDRSVFIEYLVKNLQRNEDPLLSAEQLFYSIKMGVINNSPNGQVPQYGVVFGAKDEGGDFIFLKK